MLVNKTIKIYYILSFFSSKEIYKKIFYNITFLLTNGFSINFPKASLIAIKKTPILLLFMHFTRQSYFIKLKIIERIKNYNFKNDVINYVNLSPIYY